MDKDEARLAVEVINGIVKLFSQATSAYANRKRHDVEMAELSAKRHIAEKTLDLKKLEIEKAHQKFERYCDKIDKTLALMDQQQSFNLKNLAHWHKVSDKILSKILKLKSVDTEFKQLIDLWRQTESNIANATVLGFTVISDASSAVQTLRAKVPNASIGFHALRQIEQGE